MADNKLKEALLQRTRDQFLLQGIQIEWLKDYPQTLPTLVDWVYKEWHSYDSTLTKENLLKSYRERLNDDKLPFTLVAIKWGQPVGMISLKEEAEPELASIANGNPWLGTLYVVEEEQNKGLERELLNCATTIARSLGFSDAYVYTSDPSNGSWYSQNGAEVVETRPFRNHAITILKISLK